MATILIVDDREPNREFLVSLLGYGGHRLLEAADGAEGLEVARAERPDLVIADILMPTMDGYEFVQRLRADPTVAGTRVVFYTAYYHEPEAHRLAAACGVTAVLTKPAEPEEVLRIIQLALNEAHAVGTEAARVDEPAFEREHLALLTVKLSQKANELRRTNERLTALVELGLHIGSERDQGRLLQVFCDSAREIVGARYAVVGIPSSGDPPYRHFVTSGMDLGTAARVGRLGPLAGVLGSVLASGRCFRATNHGRLEAAGGPPALPSAAALLAAPLLSPARVHGWVCLLDKIGGGEFDDEDEQLARMLGAQVGRIYENGSLYADLLRQSTKLAEEVAERRRAEDEVRRTTKLLRAVADGTTDAVFVKDRAGRYLFLNEATARFVGKPVAEVLGRDDTELFDPDSARVVLERDLRIMATGVTETEEEQLTAAGVTRTYLATKGPYRDAAGDVVGLIGISHDITDRKRAEQRSILFRALIDRTTDFIEVIDPETSRFLDANERACAAHGYTREEYLALSVPDVDPLVAARSWPEVIADRRRAEVRTFESQHRRKDGSLFPVEVSLDFIHLDREYLVTVIRDITERQRAAAALRETQKRLEQVVTSSPAVLFTLAIESDQVRGLSWISENVRALLDFSPEEALAATWWLDNLHPEDRERIPAQTQSDLFASGHATHEYRFRHRNGTYRWTRGEIRLVRNATGRATEAVGSWSDITHLRQIEEQYRQAQKMEAVGRLAGGVAHDFNNLLTVINGFGEVALGGLPPGDPGRDLLQEIVSAGERAAGLTRQLLAFSRKAIIEPRHLDLQATVADVEKMLRRIIGEDVQLAIASEPDLGTVLADPGQVEQVLLNLVVNARDAMPTGGRLSIDVRNAELDEAYARAHPDVRPGRYVVVAVTDTGCGMSAETVARIFEPFFTTKGERGTGLGLATVHGIVKQSGGHVAVYSEVGLGSTFRVYFPRVEHPRDALRARAAPAAVPRGSETVLLAEDEDAVRALTRHILRGCGYTVLDARDGADALRVAAEYRGKIDLLVSDVVMPGLSGRALAARLAETRPGLKVVFLSGYTDDAVVHHGIRETEVAFVQKPFTGAALAQKVREVLDKR